MNAQNTIYDMVHGVPLDTPLIDLFTVVPKIEPVSLYGTFCGGDPTNPQSVDGNDARSSGNFADGCPDTGGVDGTGEGTDYDPSWPIEAPPEVLVIECVVGDIIECVQENHCTDQHGNRHPSVTSIRLMACENCCDCNRDGNVCSDENCCGGLLGFNQAQLIFMMIISMALMMA